MPYSVNVTFDKDLSVLSKTLGGVLMLLLIKGTLFDKKSELNNSAFCLKSLINLFTWKSDIFLLFRKDLRQLAGLQFLRFYGSKKLFFTNKVIDKTRTTQNQENFEHRFGENYLTNHLAKFLRDRIKFQRVQGFRVSTRYNVKNCQ